jgi:predicted PurR-regulated permease PerM
MSTNPPEQSPQPVREAARTLVSVDFWTGRRLAWAALVAAGITFLVFRGGPALGWTLSRVREVTVTVVLAILLAYVVAPIVDVFCALRPLAGWRWGRVTAAFITFILLGLALGSLCVLTADPLVQETVRLSGLVAGWAEDAPHKLEEWLRAYSATVPPAVADVINRRASELASTGVEWVTLFAVRVVSRGWFLVEALLVPVLAFYFVTDSSRLVQGALAWVPDRHRERVRLFTRDVDHTLHAYVRGQLILCLIAAVVTSVALYLLGVRVFLTLGVLAGVSRGVPVLGPIVAGIPIVGIALLQGGPQTGLAALLIFSAMHFVESKVIMPRVIGHQAALHPVVVIISLLVGGEFLGLLGMFIAVPIVAILRVGLLHWRAAQQEAEASPA